MAHVLQLICEIICWNMYLPNSITYFINSKNFNELRTYLLYNKGNNKIIELRTIFQRESQNSIGVLRYPFNSKLRTIRQVWRCQTCNLKPYIEEGRTKQWQLEKQMSTKHIQKSKAIHRRRTNKTMTKRQTNVNKTYGEI